MTDSKENCELIKGDLWVEISVSCTSVQTELGLDM